MTDKDPADKLGHHTISARCLQTNLLPPLPLFIHYCNYHSKVLSSLSKMPPKSKNPKASVLSHQTAPSKSTVIKPSNPRSTSGSQNTDGATTTIVLHVDSDDDKYVTDPETEDEGEAGDSFRSTPSKTDGKRTRQSPKASKSTSFKKGKAKKVQKKQVWILFIRTLSLCRSH